MRIFLETFGCQMNTLDSELVQNQLTLEGYEFVSDSKKANIILYNTCSVRDLSEHKVLSRLGVIKKRKDQGEDIKVGVLGCMAERQGEDLLKTNPHIDFLVGPSRLGEVSNLLKSLKNKNNSKHLIALSNYKTRKGIKNTLYEPMDSLEALDKARLNGKKLLSTQAFIRITRGCNKFCAFCVVPRTRGPEVHRELDSIVEESQKLVSQGVLEITLLGQTINHYPNFAKLLKRVHDENPNLKRLRFMTSYPRDFTNEMLDVMAESDRICKYLHIPAQSGSDSVLKRMNRGYTREIYLDLIRRARVRMPNISILGDMIVGFCGETEQDFEESLSLLEEVRYKNIFVFKYSPRPGTVANKKDPDDISIEVKKARNNKMLAVQRKISLEENKKLLDQNIEVLVEGFSKLDPNPHPNPLPKGEGNARLIARTQGDHIINFTGPENLIGKLIKIKINRATELALSGILEN